MKKPYDISNIDDCFLLMSNEQLSTLLEQLHKICHDDDESEDERDQASHDIGVIYNLMDIRRDERRLFLVA